MTQKEIDRIWSQTACQAFNFEEQRRNKGWAVSTMAKYAGLKKDKYVSIEGGGIPSKNELIGIFGNLSKHGLYQSSDERTMKPTEL